MPDPREALASVLSTVQPRDRQAYLRYLTRTGDWPGSRIFLEEIAACRDWLAAGAAAAEGAAGADETPTPP